MPKNRKESNNVERKFYNERKFQKENSYNDTSERIVGPTIMFVVSLIFIGIILSILVGILMGYILPEYTIITKLMNMGMSGCS